MITASARIKVIIASILVASAVSFTLGYNVSNWKHKSALYDQEQDALKEKAAYEELAIALVKRVQEEQAADKIVYRSIKESVNAKTNNVACLGVDAGRLWNDAWFGVPSTAAGVVEEAARADPFTDSEILTNQIENAEQYKECRRQLNALIDFHEKR